ncbi:MAG: hypothetical protein Roseis2KO_15330 [Roseivirga sp.]
MIILGLLAFVILSQKLFVGLAFVSNFKNVPVPADDELPTVSILVPARNEAMNLPACLDALLALDYPVARLEIIVGNDQSADATALVVSDYSRQHGHIRLFNIQPDYHNLVARSNVLAQLANVARHDLLVFLDADMEVSPGWLKNMVAPTARGYNMVSGYTEVKAQSWFDKVQQIDWMNVIMLLKAGADMKLPGTALGNNMLVSKEAYQAVGGYEQVGPTFTEDNDLTLAFRENGFRVFQLAVAEGALTLPMNSWKDLCDQRNRWMQGAFRQPPMRLLPLIISRVFMLWVLIALFWSPYWSLLMMLIIGLSEMLLSLLMAAKTKSRISLFIAFYAPVFNSLLDTFTLLTFPWNRRVIWKGRKLK